MTAQILDRLAWEGHSLVILAPHWSQIWTPASLGFVPEPSSTACYRGFWCHFRVDDRTLLLEDLEVFSPATGYPPIGEVAPGEVRRDGATYKGLARPVDVSGEIGVVREDALEFCHRDGFRSSFPSPMIWSLSFRQGKLTDAVDRSEIWGLINEAQESDYTAPGHLARWRQDPLYTGMLEAFSLGC